MLMDFEGASPQLKGKSIYIAPSADIIGKVVLYENTGIWFNTVLRGDIERIVVGARSNVQDGTVVHTDSRNPCIIGENVTIGHNAVIHGCVIGDGSLVGMGAAILSGARIGKHCLIGAGALVKENAEIAEGSLVVGIPARTVRRLTQEERETLLGNAERYVVNGKRYLAEQNR